MKKMLISMLAMAAMVSCSSESDPIDEVNPTGDSKVEIKLNAGVNVIETKVPVETGSDGFLTNDLNNVFFFKSEGENPNWVTATAIDGSIGKTNGKISFTQTQYYPTNGSNISIIGMFLGTDASSPTPSSGQITATFDGTQDILYTPTAVSGNRITAIANDLVFNHLLTQIKFKIKKDAGITEEVTIKTMTITKVNNTDVNKSITIDMTKASDYLSFNNSSTDGFTVTGVPSIALTSTASTETTPIMLEPSSSITVKLMSDSFPTDGLSAKIDGLTDTNNQFQAGKAYTITLTVKDKALGGNATISQWDEKTGDADIE